MICLVISEQITIDFKQFTSLLDATEKETFFIHFSIPNCTQCEKDVIQLEKANKNGFYAIYEVDCYDKSYNKICAKYNVTKVPQLFAFNHNMKRPRIPQKFDQAERDAEDFKLWMDRLLLRPFAQLDDAPALLSYFNGELQGRSTVFIFTILDQIGPKLWLLAAKWRVAAPFAVITDFDEAKLAALQGSDFDGLLELQSFSLLLFHRGKFIKYPGQNVQSQIDQWLEAQMHDQL